MVWRRVAQSRPGSCQYCLFSLGGVGERMTTQMRSDRQLPNAGPFDRLYDRATETLLTRPFGEDWVETRYGRTHVLLMGDRSGIPVVVFQGGNVTNPITLSWFEELAEDYYVIAPDTPGEPGKSDPIDGIDYGTWVCDLLDALDVERAAMIGPSHGGGVVLEAAARVPERITAAALVVPAGFGTSRSLSLVRVVAPSLAYRVLPRPGLLDRALARLCTDPVTDLPSVTVETIGLALRTADLKTDFPGPADSASLADFEAPVLVVSAANDPFFPTEAISDRVAAWLPNLVRHVSLTDERHFLSTAGQRRTSEEIRAFLADHDGS